VATVRYRWTHRGYIAIGVVAVAIAAAVGFRGETFDGVVVRVVDGDTVAFKGAPDEVIVRVWGVDSPEMAQPYGLDAKLFTGEACVGVEVHVDVVNVDRYGRRVGKITLPDDRDLGLELVREGLAWWSSTYAAHEEVLRGAQADAQTARRGLWRDTTPEAPWDYRRRH